MGGELGEGAPGEPWALLGGGGQTTSCRVGLRRLLWSDSLRKMKEGGHFHHLSPWEERGWEGKGQDCRGGMPPQSCPLFLSLKASSRGLPGLCLLLTRVGWGSFPWGGLMICVAHPGHTRVLAKGVSATPLGTPAPVQGPQHSAGCQVPAPTSPDVLWWSDVPSPGALRILAQTL